MFMVRLRCLLCTCPTCLRAHSLRPDLWCRELKMSCFTIFFSSLSFFCGAALLPRCLAPDRGSACQRWLSATKHCLKVKKHRRRADREVSMFKIVSVCLSLSVCLFSSMCWWFCQSNLYWRVSGFLHSFPSGGRVGWGWRGRGVQAVDRDLWADSVRLQAQQQSPCLCLSAHRGRDRNWQKESKREGETEGGRRGRKWGSRMSWQKKEPRERGMGWKKEKVLKKWACGWGWMGSEFYVFEDFVLFLTLHILPPCPHHTRLAWMRDQRLFLVSPRMGQSLTNTSLKKKKRNCGKTKRGSVWEWFVTVSHAGNIQCWVTHTEPTVCLRNEAHSLVVIILKDQAFSPESTLIWWVPALTSQPGCFGIFFHLIQRNSSQIYLSTLL